MPARTLAPRYWGGHVLALAAVAAAALLGWWQTQAWEERREAEARDLTHAEPVPLTDVLGPDDPFPADAVGRPVELAGVWVPGGTVYVSGREHEGADGYWMVTPLAIGAGHPGHPEDAPAMPVVLGWIADPGTAPEPPAGDTRLVGVLQPSESRRAADDDPADDVLPQLRTADLVQHVDQDLYGAYAIARGGLSGLPEAAVAELPAAGRFTAVRNLLYAIEWWVFGAFAAFIWWRWVSEDPDQVDADSVAT